MKINKIFLTLISLLLFSSIISAGSYTEDNEDSDKIWYKEKISKTYYNPRHDYVLNHEIEAYYDNDHRFSTYDYRHGYSYRKTTDYWVDKHDYEVRDFKIIRDSSNCLNCNRDWDDRHENDYIIYLDDDRRHYGLDRRYYDLDRYDYYDDFDWEYYDEPRVQRRYVPYLDNYDYRECYDYVPRGKLFYISCDDWLY